jgi:hypothetical protein
MNGVSQTTDDDYHAALVLGDLGTAATPRAIITYPGASATIGDASSSSRGVFSCSGLSSCSNAQYWIIAGFNLRATEAALELDTSNIKAIGNNVQCPNGNGAEACLSGGHSNNTNILGNEVTNAGNSNPSKLYHSVYFSTDANNVEVGWNWVHNSNACRGIQFHSTGGSPQYGLSVHDNLIHDIRCDGINFATVDPSKGKVEAYNNIVYNAGTGPDFPEGAANYSCIFVGQDGGTGAIDIYNNTLYNCGAGSSQYGTNLQIDSTVMTMRLRNNIVRQDNGRSYARGSQISGSNNIWFGNGSGPSQTTGNINADPKFVNLAGRDFHLQSSSPAINAGISIGLTLDRDGILRIGSADIGAYEYFSGSIVPPPPPTTSACDLNGDGTTNSTDSQIAVDQALGRASCGNGDINHDGACNVVDVQRVINAALGGACSTTP